VVGRGFAGPGRRRGALDAFVVGVRTTQIDVVDCVARSREDTFTRDAGRGTDCLDAIWRERVFHRRLTIRAGTMVRRALYEALYVGWRKTARVPDKGIRPSCDGLYFKGAHQAGIARRARCCVGSFVVRRDKVDGRPCGVGSSVVCRGRGHFFLFCVLTFLKRQYTLHDDGSLTIQTHEKHITQLCSLLGLNVRNQNKKNPAHADIEKGDDTADFSSTSATGHNFQNLRWCFDVSGD
jgi:hypothetical protein